MTPDWIAIILTAALAGIPALLACGALWQRVARLETDVERKASREIFEERLRHIDEKVTQIRETLRRMNGERDSEP